MNAMYSAKWILFPTDLKVFFNSKNSYSKPTVTFTLTFLQYLHTEFDSSDLREIIQTLCKLRIRKNIRLKLPKILTLV